MNNVARLEALISAKRVLEYEIERLSLKTREPESTWEWHVQRTQGQSKDQAILDAIRDNAPISITALARLLGRDRANVSRRVQKLESVGLIRREREGWVVA